MAYTDEEWDNVLAFLNEESEKRPPAGIGKVIESVDEFIQMLRITEAIKQNIVDDTALRERREFQELERHKAALDQSVIDQQERIDNHPGNPGRP